MTEDDLTYPEHSPSYEQYFASLGDEVTRLYEVAEAARSKGFDPTTRVEIPPAHDVAARVEATLDGPKGVARRIRELQKDLSREQVAFEVAKEIAEGSLGNFDRKEDAAEKAVRVALAILTESITAAPLEGIAHVRIRGSGAEQYLAIYLAGPIRAAGGTEAAMTVLVADYVRQVLNLPPYIATEDEVERALEEVDLYARNVHLQYPVHPEMIKFAARHMPIMLTGEATEEFEVTGYRDLERIDTGNRVRGGAVLVLNDGVVGRAAKLAKIVNNAGITGWEWLDELAKITKAESTEEEVPYVKQLEPKSDYLSDVIAGRPVFAHPSRPGGFRLRYGRSRNTGLAGIGVHPATMFIVEEFLAPGTHIRTERPGKGSIVAPVDTIEGPIVLLKNGVVVRVCDINQARRLEGRVRQIISLGDILVAFGEFLENNHPLAPAGYCEEWWSHELDQSLSSLTEAQITRRLSGSGMSMEDLNTFIESPLQNRPTPDQATHLSKKFKIPLHPFYLYRWSVLSTEEVLVMRDWILSNHTIHEGKSGPLVSLPRDKEMKKLLERVGIPHRWSGDKKRILLTDSPLTILAQLGMKTKKATKKSKTALDVLNSVSDVILRDKIGCTIGARMGRPEKAEARRMKPPVHALFPVGRSGGTERRIEKVAADIEYETSQTSMVDNEDGEASLQRRILRICPECRRETYRLRCQKCGARTELKVDVELVSRICPRCKTETFESRCPECKVHTDLLPWCGHEECGLPFDLKAGKCPQNHIGPIQYTKGISWHKKETFLRSLLDRVMREIGEIEGHGVRGVLGLTNEYKIPEYLGKGILRAKHDVYCYRDGTARFDATDAPLTHFTPREIEVPVKRLRELGYLTDYQGEPLINEFQIVELKVQDVVIPENCADYLLRVGRFVDDCLRKIYGLDSYYNFKTQDDLIGQLVIGLAPHTSAGIIGRIIGFTSASVCYAHPYWHAAKRRNCDGDEDALILVMDALLNFSKDYLPSGRGRFMDAPLVLSVILNPSEVDDESHNLEVCRRYPAQFYEMVTEARHPKDMEKLVDIVASRLNTPAQYEGFGFTHNTSSIDSGPKNSRYKIVPKMAEKLDAQLKLAQMIQAVDAHDVAERVLMRHFFRDIRGNLRAYSTQKFRCLSCNRSYRRIPLSGRCDVCGKEKISLTVRQSNISKYLDTTEKIIHDHGLDAFLQERLRLIRFAMGSLFTSEQTLLSDYFDT
ncbi:MAG: DNA polymerase II large subunit [Candidatus Thorarchaeota archaeon]|nr:MAG: DNA polymerase II large subunit [Candidatus Thorarchaeota archaeon]RLI60251.1 MAG: DNA polymerase II large subunit [Candidatus Thorarchaeota archaeon]